MKYSFVGLVSALVLLAIAFSPPILAAAEADANVHFGDHLLILLAGALLAYATYPLLRHLHGLNLARLSMSAGVATLGLLIFLASQIPAFDALADATMTVHVLQHLLVLVSGGLMGVGVLALAGGSTTATSSRLR